MKLLFIGDIVGKGGRETVRNLVPELRREFGVSFVVANAENSAGGNGMTKRCLAEMSGVVDVFTGGDHIWDQKGFDAEIDSIPNLVRPANLHKTQPGKGFGIFRNPAGGEIAVINLLGKVFMKDSAYCPFECVDNILKSLPATVKTVLVDFHAEATSEKIAMSYFLDGRVTAVLGTHTHVQTNDAVVRPGGCAFMADAGMTGADTSVLGREVADVVRKFTSGMPSRLNVVESGIIRLDGALITYDYNTGKASEIVPVCRKFEMK
ncbi:MAG: YmdB family metallophosphoesterase [Lentisphaeria bacterium]|nr:YmdB family metallophosphoesterase [Lentisphaeria bacterium]